MILRFASEGTADIFHGTDSKAARRTCPRAVWAVARRKLDQLNQAEQLDDLRSPPANRLEKLKGERAGQYSIRINDQYRVTFAWTDRGPDQIAILDYHR